MAHSVSQLCTHGFEEAVHGWERVIPACLCPAVPYARSHPGRCLQACNRSTVYCVPLYDVLGDHSVEYIIEHSGTLRCTVLCYAHAVLCCAVLCCAHAVVRIGGGCPGG